MQLIAYLREETPIYWVKLGGGFVIKFLIILSNTMLAVGWCFL